MAQLTFHISGWAAWTPGCEALPSAGVPVLLRRRVSLLGQQALRAAWGLPAVATSRLIFSSRHGEFARTLSILDALTNDQGVSPADFTLSVHHALAGLLSIAHGNRQGHTAVAAGPESFGFAMLEALACLADNPAEPVVVVHYDEPLPPPFSDFNGGEEAIALALSLSATGDGETLALDTAPAKGPCTAGLAHDFLGFLEGSAADATSTGERLSWHWSRR